MYNCLKNKLFKNILNVRVFVTFIINSHPLSLVYSSCDVSAAIKFIIEFPLLLLSCSIVKKYDSFRFSLKKYGFLELQDYHYEPLQATFRHEFFKVPSGFVCMLSLYTL